MKTNIIMVFSKGQLKSLIDPITSCHLVKVLLAYLFFRGSYCEVWGLASFLADGNRNVALKKKRRLKYTFYSATCFFPLKYIVGQVSVAKIYRKYNCEKINVWSLKLLCYKRIKLFAFCRSYSVVKKKSTNLVNQNNKELNCKGWLYVWFGNEDMGEISVRLNCQKVVYIIRGS